MHKIRVHKLTVWVVYRLLLLALPLLLVVLHVTIIQKGFATRKLVIRSRCAKKSERHTGSIAAENGRGGLQRGLTTRKGGVHGYKPVFQFYVGFQDT